MRRFIDSRTRWYWVLRSMKSMRRDDKRSSPPPLSAVHQSFLAQHLVDRLVRELVGALVAGHARVPFHPVPFDAMPLDLVRERLPQVDVLHRLFVRSAPVA